MTRILTAIIVIAFVPAWSSALAQTATTKTCDEWFEPQTYQDAIVAEDNLQNHRAAVIFGERQKIHPMRIRLVDGITGKPLENHGIKVIYGWRWLEYPYPEHAWGAWNDTGDRLSCQLNDTGWIETPDHEVQPRGWYDGKYTHWLWSHRPQFTGVGLVAVMSGGFARVSLKPGDLNRFTYSDLLIRVFDGWRTETLWQPRQAH